MALINNKLNLNKTPHLVDNNSLIFAKNIRIDVDKTIHKDYSIFPMSTPKGKNTKNEARVNYGTLLKRIIEDLKYYSENIDTSKSVYYTEVITKLRCGSGETVYLSPVSTASEGKFNIIGVIPNNNEFYLFLNTIYKVTLKVTGGPNRSHISESDFILCYDENLDLFYPCECNWTYSGGNIDGCVINNLLGEKILNIGEYGTASFVPIKCINLSKCTPDDDESIYTQSPNIPITNLLYSDQFSYVIPNGVYQFFIRYKIRDNFYTDWFPCSKELFAGNHESRITSFGTVYYVNTHRDSDKSFKFQVKHLYDSQTKNYQSFQIGFICSHDDSIVARAWKHFSIHTTEINFDYEAKDAIEIEVTDLTKQTYQIYNVGNVTSFKNKLYISNYKETDFNVPELKTSANKVKIDVEVQQASTSYGEYPIVTSNVNGVEVISGLTIDGTNTSFNGQNGIFDKLLRQKNTSFKTSIEDVVTSAIKNMNDATYYCGSLNYNITCDGINNSITQAQSKYKNSIGGSDVIYTTLDFGYEIKKIKVNRKIITIASGNTDEAINTTVENILSAIYTDSKYLNSSCSFVDIYGKSASNYTIEIFRDCSYKRKVWVSDDLIEGPDDNPDLPDDPGSMDKPNIRPDNPSVIEPNGHYEYKLFEDQYIQTITVRFVGDKTKYNNLNTAVLTNYTTLIPYQKYKFYIHYVKQNGEITNGYYCGGDNAGVIEAKYSPNANGVVYPIFHNIEIPSGYVACFFSILHVETNVATVYNIDNDNSSTESSSIDINLNLFSAIDNIILRQEIDGDVIETHGAKYFYSGDSSNTRYFGADGVIANDKTDGIQENSFAYAINDYVVSEAEDSQLIKCTPYIGIEDLITDDTHTNSFKDFSNMNLLGYICRIFPLVRQKTIDYYTDSNVVYYKTYVSETEGGAENFSLVELKDHLGDVDSSDPDASKKKITAMYLVSSESVTIYSNYNLNYLTLLEEPKEQYKTYYLGTSDATNQQAYHLVMRLFSSLTMSSVYQFPSMYKNYTRKTYAIYNKNSVTEFNNTVRSSELYADEASIDIFKFDANDYYNIPTNRGIIVNMIAIGDAILVHTKDSMFKFSGSNTLQSSDGEIQTNESSPFDTGVSEIFGSDFGFAGLQNKTDQIVTENGYIFFDRDARVIYMYSGQGQIIKISDEIEKLFRAKDISNVYFANDYYNNRFFVSIKFVDYSYGDIEKTENTYPVTLSFSTLQDVKSFISLHDFYYFYAFNTKTKCYFISNNNKDISEIDKNSFGYYGQLEITTDKIYPANYVVTNTTYCIEDSYNSTTNQVINKYFDSIIDVINNQNYENIKTLNAINWISRNINEEFENINDSNIDTLLMAEDFVAKFPCKAMRIYTDTCATDLFDFQKISNDYPITNIDSYMFPRFNQGFWTYNYFRNIKNAHANKTTYSDQHSLIEGKYVVVRFVFDKEFKLETLSLNYSNKI